MDFRPSPEKPHLCRYDEINLLPKEIKNDFLDFINHLLYVFQVTLSQRQGTFWTDSVNGRAWDVINISMVAHTVKLLTHNTYSWNSYSNPGFVEIELYGELYIRK